MRETVFETKIEGMEDFISFDDLRHLLPDEMWKKHNKRLSAKRISGRTIYTSEKEFRPADEIKHLWEYKRIPKEKFPMHGELTVYGNKVSMISLKGKLVGVIIESKEMATMVRTMFDLAWKQADSFQ